MSDNLPEIIDGLEYSRHLSPLIADELKQALAELDGLKADTSDPFYSNEPNDIICRVNPSAFKELKSEVNAILKAIVANPPKDRYCVNYADLRCVNVSRVIEDDGEQWWLVEMEEGDDHEFCQLVRSKLSERWGSVIVRMEW